MTKQKTIDELLEEYELDMLTEEGMRALYEGYAEDANKESDKVFNAAQRAYIAAVTAGDAKTTEQLVKLANNAGASKKNLFATSALTNQFKQQAGLNNTGRQLATDYQNQQAANLAAIAKSGLDANTALTGYLGNGADSYDAGTVYGAFNTFAQNAADNRKNYSGIGSAISNTTQGINSTLTGIDIGNRKRFSDVSSSITFDNARAGANNATNSGTRKTFTTEAKALKK